MQKLKDIFVKIALQCLQDRELLLSERASVALVNGVKKKN